MPVYNMQTLFCIALWKNKEAENRGSHRLCKTKSKKSTAAATTKITTTAAAV